MTDLHKVPQQSLEALEDLRVWRAKQSMDVTALRAALAQQDEATGKSFLQVAPVQEPVAWIQPDHLQKARIAPFLCRVEPTQRCADFVPLYTAPPQRKPLTEEEILKAIGWERAEMYMKLTPNFPVAEAKKETLKNARAIERAHGIGEQP